MNSILYRVLFFLVPALLPFAFFAAEHSMGAEQIHFFYSEFGPVEIFQETILFICLFFSVYIFRKLKSDENKWLKAWIGLAALASFYVAFEEISWGQTFFNWQTPEEWARINGQEETNIHNTSQLFNSVPRTLLEIAVLVGGVIIPLFLKFKPSKLPAIFSAIYPGSVVLFAGVVTLIVKLLEQTKGWFGVQVFYRKSEVMETFLYYFVFLYLIDLFLKWKREGRLA